MAHTRGPVHLSVEDKTFPRKEWPKGYYSEIPSAPHGMTAAPGRLNEIYHQQETRCPVLGRPCQQSYLLFLPDLFPKHLSDTYFPYWALFLFSFRFLSFIPPLSVILCTYSSSFCSYFLVQQLLLFHTLGNLLFSSSFPKNFHSWPHLFSLNDPLLFNHMHVLSDSTCP